jgi:hypothetical protein
VDDNQSRDTRMLEEVRENIDEATEEILDLDFATLGELREAFDD